MKNKNKISMLLLTLSHKGMKSNAMLLYPESLAKEKTPEHLAIVTHGYTSHKASLLSWAQRFTKLDIPTILFDLPGHLLGGFHEVQSFSDFTNHAHEFFIVAHREASLFLTKKKLLRDDHQILLFGHSLGAHLAIKSMMDKAFNEFKLMAICVGLGIYQGEKGAHLFETSFYKEALAFRGLMVSNSISPDKIFAWLKTEKENYFVKNKKIHFFTGEDDMVAPPSSVHELGNRLKDLENEVNVHILPKLPHHMPESAAPHLAALIKKKISNKK